MKASFRLKTAGIVASACVLLVGGTALAASGIVSSIEPVSTIRNDKDTSMETRMVGDVAVKYSLDEYLFLPPSMEGQVSQELLDRIENDDHFFISYGSDQEETQMVTNLSFDVDGVHYCLMTFDTTLTVDELFDMVEELIMEGK